MNPAKYRRLRLCCGREIALWAREPDGSQKIAVIDVMGEDPVQVIGGQSNQFNSDAAWSRDGRRLIFSSGHMLLD
ncbi:MAG TPA: hypothetical protein VGN12_19030 [Pirellulales bacterium]